MRKKWIRRRVKKYIVSCQSHLKYDSGFEEARPGGIFVLGENIKTGYPKLKEDIGVVLDEANFPDPFKIPRIGKIMAGLYKN